MQASVTAVAQMSTISPTIPTPDAPAAPRPPDWNRIGLDYRKPMPRPKVRGMVIDAHCHLIAARHAKDWFEAADHYGIDQFITMSPLEEALVLQREWGHRLQFIAIPNWRDPNPDFDDWHRRLDGFFNLGSRIIKFHMAPGTMQSRGWN